MGMSLDEAITHAEEVAEENQAIVDSCDYYGENMAKCEKCAKEHRQLAEWLKDYKRLKEQEKTETVSIEAFEQVKWERDIAIQQLKGLGYGFGEKRRTDDDAISRQAVLDIIDSDWKYEGMERYINDLPPVNPQAKTGHWIYNRRRDWDGECKYECSECGMGSDVDYAYCMRCGTIMVGRREV